MFAILFGYKPQVERKCKTMLKRFSKIAIWIHITTLIGAGFITFVLTDSAKDRADRHEVEYVTSLPFFDISVVFIEFERQITRELQNCSYRFANDPSVDFSEMWSWTKLANTNQVQRLVVKIDKDVSYNCADELFKELITKELALHVSKYSDVIGAKEFRPVHYFGTNPFENLASTAEVTKFQQVIQDSPATSQNISVTSIVQPKLVLSKISFNLIWIAMWRIVSLIAYAFFLFPPNPSKPKNPNTNLT